MEIECSPAMKSFVVNLTSGSIRKGFLKNATQQIETPACIIHSRFGLPSYLSSDLLHNIKSPFALHLCIQDVAENVQSVEKYGKGYKSFCNAPDQISVFSCRDPTNYLESSQGTLQIQAKSGRMNITVENFNRIVRAVDADFSVAMSYEIPWTHTRKRHRKLVDMALAWLDQSLKMNPDLKDSIFGVVQGGGEVQERIRAATEMNKRAVFGIMIGGFNLDENDQLAETAIPSVIQVIDPAKPRMIMSKGDPFSVLRDVGLGIDLVCTSYLDTVANLGCALTWNLRPSSDMATREDSEKVMISLREQRYIFDKSPLVADCTCYTCANHSKAYLYHLLNTHEMLSVTLLQIHNLHHYTQFFQQIRNSIQEGDFESYKTAFCQSVIS